MAISAKEFIDCLRATDSGDNPFSQATSPANQKLAKVLRELQDADIVSKNRSGFVLRNRTHGAPVLLYGMGSEIWFQSVSFAYACAEELAKQGTRPDVLMLR